MKYKAVFGIDGGVSHGFGIKYPDYIEKTKEILAESDYEAFNRAINQAKEISKEHLSNPKTGYTAVKVLILKDEKGRPLCQESLNKNPKIIFEEGCALVKSSTLEHLLNL